jgi:hypothetical protein
LWIRDPGETSLVTANLSIGMSRVPQRRFHAQFVFSY